MSTLRSLLLAFATMACTVAANAGAISNAKVVALRVDQDGRGMVFFDKPISNSPACINASAYASAMAFDSTTAGGKAILAFAIQLRSMGTSVSVWGPGTCTIYGGSHVEDWGYGTSVPGS